MGTEHFVLAFLFFGLGASVSQEDESKNRSLTCNSTSLKDVHTEGDLYDNLIPKVIDPKEDEGRMELKRRFVQYLVRSRTFLEIIRCTDPALRLPRQEEEDGDDGEDGGGAAGGIGGAGGVNPLDNTNVVNGVRRILANVLTGNLIGVIQEGVALRGPAPVTTVFTDVLSTLFGSTATAGITGVLGNVTTIAPPLTENATLSFQEQQYLFQQHQQYLLAQQQQQQQGQLGAGGRPWQGLQNSGAGGAQAQKPSQYPPFQQQQQQYPQFQQQQQTFPSFPNQAGSSQPQQGGIQTKPIRRRPGAAVGQQQEYPQQNQNLQQQQFPQQNQQLVGGLNRQHQQLQNQQFGGGALQGQRYPAGLNQPQSVGGNLGGSGNLGQSQRLQSSQGNRRRPAATLPPETDYIYDDKD